MKNEIIGIIAEFNPFHNGHKKLINYVKNKYPDCTIIVAMSGQFVQRGELAIYDKWERSFSAINSGVDLVLEIPPYFVLNNANIFANQALKILNKCGVTKIIFGTEKIDLNKINFFVEKIINNKNEINNLKKECHSLPRAIEKIFNEKILPNDILGICYVLESEKNNYKFKFERIKRINSKNFPPASKIRKKIYKNNLEKSIKIRNINDYSEIIIGKILTTNSSHNIINYLRKKIIDLNINNFNELINLSHNKSFTKSKIRREILKFILDLEKSEKIIVLASNKNGNYILKKINNYYFRHTKDNIDNYKVELFISLNKNENVKNMLSKKTIQIK